MISLERKVRIMKKIKLLSILFILIMLLLFLPSISNATDVTATRNIYSNNGSMKFNFTGLTLDTTHEYEYGLTKTAATEVETWYLITDYTTTSATVDLLTTTKKIREVINVVDTGYITIKDKTTDTVIVQPYAVDLKIPFLMITNYTVLPNGKEFDASSNNIKIALRNASNSTAYYQYEKITDENVIRKYKEIKANNGDFSEMQGILKTTVPTSNWTKWGYWNNFDSDGMDGYGYTQRTVSVPDSGLYYMWVYFSGNNVKNIYGYILVDNLEPDIALEGISLPSTATVELGKTLTLQVTFNPSNATNKIVTWTSSDETVATVDNAGKVTPIKTGSTIIKATSQDGKKNATTTVTVTEVSNKTNEQDNNNKEQKEEQEEIKTNEVNSNVNKDTNKTENTTPTTPTSNDSTTATGTMPQTGESIGLSVTIICLIGVGIFMYRKNKLYKDIK
jgi:hypothetical protein